MYNFDVQLCSEIQSSKQKAAKTVEASGYRPSITQSYKDRGSQSKVFWGELVLHTECRIHTGRTL